MTSFWCCWRFATTDVRRRGDPKVDHGCVGEVDDLALHATAQVAIEFVARHREEVGAEALHPVQRLLVANTGQHRALDEVLDLVIDLAGEEAIEVVEVALQQLAARRRVTAAPLFEELEVVLHELVRPAAARRGTGVIMGHSVRRNFRRRRLRGSKRLVAC